MKTFVLAIVLIICFVIGFVLGGLFGLFLGIPPIFSGGTGQGGMPGPGFTPTMGYNAGNLQCKTNACLKCTVDVENYDNFAHENIKWGCGLIDGNSFTLTYSLGAKEKKTLETECLSANPNPTTCSFK